MVGLDLGRGRLDRGRGRREQIGERRRRSPGRGSVVTAISVVGATAASIAARYALPEAANTSPGVIRSMISRSLPKSCETSE